MKHVLFSLAIPFLLLINSPVKASGDTGKHLIISGVIGVAAENFIHTRVDTDAKRIAYGTLLGSVPGLLKEISDDHSSRQDMAANIAGAFIGSYIGTKINKNLYANIQKHDDGYMVGVVLND